MCLHIVELLIEQRQHIGMTSVRCMLFSEINKHVLFSLLKIHRQVATFCVFFPVFVKKLLSTPIIITHIYNIQMIKYASSLLSDIKREHEESLCITL